MKTKCKDCNKYSNFKEHLFFNALECKNCGETINLNEIRFYKGYRFVATILLVLFIREISQLFEKSYAEIIVCIIVLLIYYPLHNKIIIYLYNNYYNK